MVRAATTSLQWKLLLPRPLRRPSAPRLLRSELPPVARRIAARKTAWFGLSLLAPLPQWLVTTLACSSTHWRTNLAVSHQGKDTNREQRRQLRCSFVFLF